MNKYLITFSLFILSISLFANEMTGFWKTYDVTNWGFQAPANRLNMDVCILDGEFTYLEARSTNKTPVQLQLELKHDDVYIFSARRGELLGRKLVLLHRSKEETILGTLHLYDGFRPFNALDVFLVKEGDSCPW